ncbi:hypothetical protein H4582DRAFT_2057425 [Lactarius indigo]|nr:hypothetical protein H4582DRAFT_2057425 [Lactarius indigo]
MVSAEKLFPELLTQPSSWVQAPGSYAPGYVSSLVIALEDPDGKTLKVLLVQRTLYAFGNQGTFGAGTWKPKPRAKAAAHPTSATWPDSSSHYVIGLYGSEAIYSQVSASLSESLRHGASAQLEERNKGVQDQFRGWDYVVLEPTRFEGSSQGSFKNHDNVVRLQASSSASSDPHKALKGYKKNTGKDFTTHPLVADINGCYSPEATLTILQGKANELEHSRRSDERLFEWLTPTVDVLNALSATLDGVLVPTSSLVTRLCPNVNSQALPFYQDHLSALVFCKPSCRWEHFLSIHTAAEAALAPYVALSYIYRLYKMPGYVPTTADRNVYHSVSKERGGSPFGWLHHMLDNECAPQAIAYGIASQDGPWFPREIPQEIPRHLKISGP